MAKQFSYFTICAEMRTGSNFLEASLNEFPDLQCYGEAYNPHFVGHHNKEEMFGVDLEMREQDPLELIERMKSETDGIPGFRFFNDHDPRVRDHILMDPGCAKIILTRNPLDSYVSLKIAAQTGQWKLSDVKQRRSAIVSFDETEFQEHLESKQVFQLDILRHLQITGQTAYYIAYEDVGELEIVNGLAKFIGSAERIDSLPKSVKKQNPGSLEEKVVNFDEMVGALANVDHFAMSRTPNFEPRRGPGVPGFVHAAKSPLLFVPIGGGPNHQILTWLAQLDDVDDDELGRKLSQKDLRQWKRNNPGHRSFSVLTHPLERAHRVFCEHLLPICDNGFSDPRRIMRNRYGIPFPNQAGLKEYELEAHKAAFSGFLKFLKGNLAGQTSVRIDVNWATQSAILDGAGQVIFPDLLIREKDLKEELDLLAKRTGKPSPDLEPLADVPFSLADIHDDELEKLAQQAYRRDYINFGFEPWA